ncbi:hypothetical protein EDD16DRAFT_957349 [Pisolithus croceorrhizus]|nr:hypothetical protein EDD16DRAFT_957349 [Pisolithus croceorrhizus]
MGFKDRPDFAEHGALQHPESHRYLCQWQFDSCDALQSHIRYFGNHPKCINCDLRFADHETYQHVRLYPLRGQTDMSHTHSTCSRFIVLRTTTPQCPPVMWIRNISFRCHRWLIGSLTTNLDVVVEPTAPCALLLHHAPLLQAVILAQHYIMSTQNTRLDWMLSHAALHPSSTNPLPGRASCDNLFLRL